MVAEIIPHDWRLQFRSLNHGQRATTNSEQDVRSYLLTGHVVEMAEPLQLTLTGHFDQTARTERTSLS